jgi:probable HAF family extracellular repeat protein
MSSSFRFSIVSALLVVPAAVLLGVCPRLEAAKPTGGAPGYTVTKLGGLVAHGTLLVTQANGLTNPDAQGRVHVVGMSREAIDPYHIPYYPYVWTVSSTGALLATDNLGQLPGFDYSYGLDINQAGVVVGGSNHTLGFVIDPTDGMQQLPQPAQFITSVGIAVNNAGAIVGRGMDTQDVAHGLRWQLEGDGTVTGPIDLGAFFPNAINDWGVMAGEQSGLPAIAELDASSHVQVEFLGVLSGHASGEAHGINNLGDVVGQSNSSSGLTQAVVWPAGSPPIALKSLGKNLSSSASDINEQGKIVGWSYAVVSGTTMRDLNTLAGISGKTKYRVTVATAINNTSQISGVMNVYGGGQDDLAVVLTRKP